MRLRIGVLAGLVAASLAFAALSRAEDGAASAAAQPSSDAAPTSVSEPNPQRGRKAFQRYCSVCHGPKGEGGVGPSLQGISTRLTAEQIAHQVVEPRGSMPRLYPSPVDDSALGDLNAYLKLLK